MNILLVYAQPEPSSLTQHLVREAEKFLLQHNHRVSHSDLYAMGWKSVMDEADFTQRKVSERLSFIHESENAFSTGTQAEDIHIEQQKLQAADALILLFPLWWFSMPAIMKGWIDRVWAYGLAYGYKNAGNRYRYGEGAFAGKRALLTVSIGGPSVDYGSRGINGKLDDLLFPITHGTMFYTGMEVLPTFAIYNSGKLNETMMKNVTENWQKRLYTLFSESPISFRLQNGGDYSDGHTLNPPIKTNATGLSIHHRD